jgi:hypothetical protein
MFCHDWTTDGREESLIVSELCLVELFRVEIGSPLNLRPIDSDKNNEQVLRCCGFQSDTHSRG